MKKKYKRIMIFVTLIWIFIILLSVIVNRRAINREKEIVFLSNYLSSDEINFMINNHLNIEDVKPYLEYKNFSIYYFNSYEKIRNDYNLTHLESINYYNNPNYFRFYKNPKPAVFVDTPLVLVNKCFYLDENFFPSDLVKVKDYPISYVERENEEILLKKIVVENLVKMFSDAEEQKLDLVIFSGFRTYSKQEYLYYTVYKQDDTISARPGFSEHQSGYAVDISTMQHGLTENFKLSSSYKWLVNNAHKYGFILRYPENKNNLTGYIYEPWHFRYVGNIATTIFEEGYTLEEYIFSNREI